jgi:hypothetical protein
VEPPANPERFNLSSQLVLCGHGAKRRIPSVASIRRGDFWRAENPGKRRSRIAKMNAAKRRKIENTHAR